MRKTIAVALLLCSSSWASALDWGVNVTEVPLVMAGPTNLFVESLKVATFATQPLWGAELKAQGEASWSASTAGGDWNVGEVSFDLTELSLKGGGALEGGTLGIVEWDAGRRSVSDLTGGWVLGSRWDGVSVSWTKGSTGYNTALGYSGLLTKKSSRLSVSAADAADQADPQVTMSPRRIYGEVGWSQNELFLRQDFQVEALGNFDLRPGTEAVSTFYLTGQLSGPLLAGFRHKSFATLNLNAHAKSLPLGMLVGSEASASLPFLGSRLVLNGALALGTSEEGFEAVSGKGMADVVGLPSNHGATVGMDYSLKPLPKTTAGAKATLLLRTSHDPVALPGFLPESKQSLLGTEVGAYASWNPTSEASFGLNTGLFLPYSPGFSPATPPSFLLVLTATVKL